MADRGDIILEEAYAQGKMLDHSDWLKGHRYLPRGSFPCDFDMVFDNRGRVLYGALERNIQRWRDQSVGQCRAYQSAIRKGEHCAVLCRHDVPACRKINTRSDILSFQPMIFAWGDFRIAMIARSNDQWQQFVLAWFTNPDGLWGEIFQRSVVF